MMTRRGWMVGGINRRIIRDVLMIFGCALGAGLLLRTFLLGAFVVPTRSMEGTLIPGDFVLVNRLAYGVSLPHCAALMPAALSGSRLVRFSSPRRGDIIAFNGSLSRDPGCATPTLLKRCVALPGDTLVFKGNWLRVNGLVTELPPAARRRELGSVVLPRAGDEVELSRYTAALLRPLIEDEGDSLAIREDGVVLVNGRVAESYTVRQDAYFVLGDNRSSSFDSRSFGVVPAGRVIGKAFLVYWSRTDAVQRSSLATPLAGVRWSRIGKLLR